MPDSTTFDTQDTFNDLPRTSRYAICAEDARALNRQVQALGSKFITGLMMSSSMERNGGGMNEWEINNRAADRLADIVQALENFNSLLSIAEGRGGGEGK